MEAERIIIEQTVRAPIDKVWNAISNKDEMKSWSFDLGEFQAEVGFEFQFYGGPPERQYLHSCKVTEVMPKKRLSYSWRYEGFPGDSLVTFELANLGSETQITLTHSGLDSFPQDLPDFAFVNFKQGWTEIIRSTLKAYLEK